ncbi:unnamed protein product [Mytilus coruscus]|uniref:Uncharacterized protein n=1 Tax=Mytilus coruscus TaxID=42192 RepID=A0A6J8BZT9_MYTCO|nr:unnamed protein product [Mytilus coruscus]
MNTQDIKPGFTILKLGKSSFISNDSITFRYSDIWEKDIVLSNVKVKQFLKSENKEFDFVHGPCITDKDYTRDYAFCFRCPTWIGQAQKLRGKSRLWPCPSVVENIESVLPTNYCFYDDLHYEQLDYKGQQALKYGCLDISSIYRRHVITPIDFTEDLNLPFDIIDELKNRHVFTNSNLPPVVYAHYLRFLCFLRLYDGENYRKSLQDIQLTIENDYFVCEYQKVGSYKLLAIAHLKIGNRNAAKKYLAVADRHISKS